MKTAIAVVAFCAGVVVATESIIAAIQEPRTPGQQKLNDAFTKRTGLALVAAQSWEAAHDPEGNGIFIRGLGWYTTADFNRYYKVVKK